MNLRYGILGLVAILFVVLLLASTRSLAQIDAPDNNNNGIWDYVDEYIDAKYPEPSDIRPVAQQYAISLQKALVEADNPDAAQNNLLAFRHHMGCLIHIAGEEEGISTGSELRLLVVNTPERSKALMTLVIQVDEQQEQKFTDAPPVHSESCQY